MSRGAARHRGRIAGHRSGLKQIILPKDNNSKAFYNQDKNESV